MKYNDTQPSHTFFFRFLTLAQSIESIPTGAGLTPNETQLLYEIALSHFEGQAIYVKQALALKELGSPATLHKRIQRLRETGFLSVEQKAADYRTKYLVVTPLAIQLFESLGLAMQKAIHG
jgi:DNA-binding MarR family transcriptional regulator